MCDQRSGAIVNKAAVTCAIHDDRFASIGICHNVANASNAQATEFEFRCSADPATALCERSKRSEEVERSSIFLFGHLQEFSTVKAPAALVKKGDDANEGISIAGGRYIFVNSLQSAVHLNPKNASIHARKIDFSRIDV
ncbi:hypothetical protein [Paraburkholderia fungorum]|uniref:hypothetical protein n=1 Tax=Paraburkholderia fungorum TaxID=134537 RepID=UPI00149622F1|nr:hypothetical protein [Paraburkholderia fungorum]